MSEPKTSSGHKWLILSFALPCVVVGLSAVVIYIWDMWGSSEPSAIFSSATQAFFWFGLPAGIVGIPIGYVINQIRTRGLWG